MAGFKVRYLRGSGITVLRSKFGNTIIWIRLQVATLMLRVSRDRL